MYPYQQNVMKTAVTTMTLEAWIDTLQTGGRYSFLRAEAIAEGCMKAAGMTSANWMALLILPLILVAKFIVLS